MSDLKQRVTLGITEEQKLEAMALATDMYRQELKNAKKHIKTLKGREMELVDALQCIANLTNGRILDDYNTANDAVNLAQATLKSLGIEGEE